MRRSWRHPAIWLSVFLAFLAVTASTWADDSTEATTFTTVGEHTYTVPSGVTSLDITAVGGSGGSSNAGANIIGGSGADISSTLAVRPGEVLYAEVGSSATGATPGANGGGSVPATALCAATAGAGGGASDVRTLPLSDPGSLSSRVLVAAGGGGSGSVSSGESTLAGDGGNRGDYGRTSSTTGLRNGAGGGAGGYGGTGGTGDGASAGAAGSGGTGAAPTSTAYGCGGGGGGGYGGGAGGSAASSSNNAGGGGGGGGGGSLVPDGAVPGLPATFDQAPEVSFTPAPPVSSDAGTLLISPDLSIVAGSSEDCGTSCDWCALSRSTMANTNTSCPQEAASSALYDGGVNSEENWSSNSLLQSYRSQSGLGIIDAPAGDPGELGEPVALADTVVWNEADRGNAVPPTVIDFGGTITVQPPAGDPVTLTLGADASQDGSIPFSEIGYLDTDNTATVSGCDPSIQVSTVPCDDQISLLTPLSTTTTVNGLTWTVTLLGWDNQKGSGYSTKLAAEEDTTTTSELYGEITVDTLSTATALSSDASNITASVTPAPSTGGTVSFSSDGAVIPGCGAVSVSTTDGTAACPLSAIDASAHQVTASYSGGVGYATSASPAQTITGTGAVPNTGTATTPAATPPATTSPATTSATGTMTTTTTTGTSTTTTPAKPAVIKPRILALSVEKRTGLTARLKIRLAAPARVTIRVSRRRKVRVRGKLKAEWTVLGTVTEPHVATGVRTLSFTRVRGRRLTAGVYRFVASTTAGARTVSATLTPLATPKVHTPQK